MESEVLEVCIIRDMYSYTNNEPHTSRFSHYDVVTLIETIVIFDRAIKQLEKRRKNAIVALEGR